MHELPLMAFTLLLQASVGMTLWLAFLHRHILITSSAPPGYAAAITVGFFGRGRRVTDFYLTPGLST